VDAVKNVFKSHSPSLVMEGIGKDVMKGLEIGMGKQAKSVIKTVTGIGTKVFNTYARLVGKSQKDWSKKQIKHFNAVEKKVKSFGKSWKDLAGNAKASAERYAAAVKDYTDFATSITANSASFGSIINAFSDITEGTEETTESITTLVQTGSALGGWVSTVATSITKAVSTATTGAGSLIASFTKKALDVTAFTAQVEQLAAAGLNQATLRDIIEAGVGDGGSVASAILGDPSQIANINALQAQITASATRLGTFAADLYYGQGVADAEAELAGYVAMEEQYFSVLLAMKRRVAQRIIDNLGLDMFPELAAVGASGANQSGGGGGGGGKHAYKPPQGKSNGPCRVCGRPKGDPIHNGAGGKPLTGDGGGTGKSTLGVAGLGMQSVGINALAGAVSAGVTGASIGAGTAGVGIGLSPRQRMGSLGTGALPDPTFNVEAPTVNVYLDSLPIEAIVKTEVVANDRRTASRINKGKRRV
jgi:hypothetical protein